MITRGMLINGEVDYGVCECGYPLDAHRTIVDNASFMNIKGDTRKRSVADYLFCEMCGKSYCIDDSFDYFI